MKALQRVLDRIGRFLFLINYTTYKIHSTATQLQIFRSCTILVSSSTPSIKYALDHFNRSCLSRHRTWTTSSRKHLRYSSFLRQPQCRMAISIWNSLTMFPNTCGLQQFVHDRLQPHLVLPARSTQLITPQLSWVTETLPTTQHKFILCHLAY